jgi:hypothetical protein
MPPRHRFLEPIHNVKEGVISAKSAAEAAKLVFIPGAAPSALSDWWPRYRDRTDDLKLAKLLVEPIGSMTSSLPMTSSLQS